MVTQTLEGHLQVLLVVDALWLLLEAAAYRWPACSVLYGIVEAFREMLTPLDSSAELLCWKEIIY